MQGFGDVKVFQVTPGKEEAFETLLPEMVNQLYASNGCNVVHVLKRSHTYDALQDPPRSLTKLVKS
ncbi:MAG TPA: hypothetical protein VLR89_02735, partial [Anaerolineaceae bacterium]|nr:hypothetical protein [Anaerolineaceae bacterium]